MLTFFLMGHMIQKVERSCHREFTYIITNLHEYPEPKRNVKIKMLKGHCPRV